MLTSSHNPAQRRCTRAFARLNGIEIPHVTLEDLDTATRRLRSQRRKHPQPAGKASLVSPPKKLPDLESKINKNQESTSIQKPNKKVPKKQAAALTLQNSPLKRRLRNTSLDQVHGPSERGLKANPPQRRLVREELGEKKSGQNSSVSTWLEQLRPEPPPSDQDPTETPQIPDSSPYFNMAYMESSSSVNTSNSAANNDDKHTQASTVKRVTFAEALLFRGITSQASPDDVVRKSGLHTINDTITRSIDSQELRTLLTLLKTLVAKTEEAINTRASNGMDIYNELREKVYGWNPAIDGYRRIPPMLPAHFAWDRQHCLNSSEADFHRTIMISIIDRYDLQDLFAFSCEEQWRVDPRFLILPSRQKATIKQPKPDLAISFRYDALGDDDELNYPPELASCLHPGSQGLHGWFPFLFMEAKKGGETLLPAFESNLHSASQALYNIFQWMQLEPGLKMKFFKDVRVLTIALNNEKIHLRMHRAEMNVKGQIRYKFADVICINDFDEFHACHLIKSVLVDYAQKHLFPILKETFRIVSKMDIASQTSSNRKRNRTQTTTEDEEEPEDRQAVSGLPALRHVNTGLSTDANDLALEDAGSTPKRGKQNGRRRGRA